jgi:hypothetical protein
MEILVIKKKRYAVGLSPWLALPSRGKVKNLAAKKTRDLKGKGFCSRPSPIPQVGIASEWVFSKDDKPLKRAGIGPIYSLATAIAGNQPESWVGFFHITEKSWWVISVMNGVIVPDGDYLTSDEESARRFFDTEVSRLSQEVSPVEINDVAESIAWLEAHLSTRYLGKLQKNGVNKEQILLAGVAGVVVVSGACWYFWHEHELSVAREKARQALLLKIKREQLLEKEKKKAIAAVQAPKLQARPEPWVGKPLFSAYAMAVRGVFDRVPMASFGWQLTGLKCDVDTCTATYRRADHVATFWLRPKKTLPDIATKTVSRSYPLSISDSSQHIGMAHLSVWMMGWMQIHGIRGSVTPADENPVPYMPQRPMNNGKPVQKFLPPTWKSLSWTIHSAFSPWRLGGISIDGIVPETADYNAEDGEWTITGKAYESIK